MLSRKRNSVFIGGSQLSTAAVKPSFDILRGINPSINSANDLISFMPTHHEHPRLAVLENFKQINK